MYIGITIAISYLIKMKFLVLISIFGLSIFLTTSNNASSLIAQSQRCYYDSESYPEGSQIEIGGRTYKCRGGKWVLVTG